MATTIKKSHFVLMPGTNVSNSQASATALPLLRPARNGLARSNSAALHGRATSADTISVNGHAVTVLDTVAPGESLLIALSSAEFAALSIEQPGIRIVPVVELRPCWLRGLELTAPLGLSTNLGWSTLLVTVLAADSSKPCPGVEVYGFTDRARQVGVSQVTNAAGVVALKLPTGIAQFEVVEVAAPDGYWAPYVCRVKRGRQRLTLRCPAIELAAPDVRDHFALRGADTDGAGVVVGVIDTGVTVHRDLRITKAVSVVLGDAVGDVSDQLGHGTHVCGIISGQGVGCAARGVAPGIDLYVYKVFGTGQKTAQSFNIAKAIRQAVNDGCDLINLSLGADSDMPEVLREIVRARALGVLCIAASGNGYRGPVGYPAAYGQVLAVAACGRKGSYPHGVTQELRVAAPFGVDPDDFASDFGNIGSQIGLIGPGVGIVSTWMTGYAVMDGTSMACPLATGAVARLLARHPKILYMARTQKRSNAIIKLALTEARTLGFGAAFEGAGILV